MFVTNWISTTKIQKISEITNFFRHYFLSRTEVFHELSVLTLLTLHSEGLALLYHAHQFCVHNKEKYGDDSR